MLFSAHHLKYLTAYNMYYKLERKCNASVGKHRNDMTNNVTPRSLVFSAYHPKDVTIHQILLAIGTKMHCKCVPTCNNLLQIETQLHCKCVPICNNLLQIGTQLHCKCVPICNNSLHFGTQLHCKCVPICNKKSDISKLKKL